MEENKNVTAVDTETYYDGTSDEDYAEDEAVDDASEDEDEDSGIDNETDVEDESAEDFEDDEPAEESEDDDNGDDQDINAGDADTEESSQNKESDLERVAKDLLKELGIEHDDPVKAIRGLIAESKGMSLEELDRLDESNRALEEQMKRDIEEIHKAYPITKKYKTLHDLPKKAQFGALMDDKKLGLTAAQAFAASHPEIVAAQNAARNHKDDLRDTKKHLTSNVPKGAKDNSTPISKRDMEAYREMFPGLSKEEITKLYKKANR